MITACSTFWVSGVMNGISRFVMGLFNHIKVMGDDNFMLYIRNEVESMKM